MTTTFAKHRDIIKDSCGKHLVLVLVEPTYIDKRMTISSNDIGQENTGLHQLTQLKGSS